MTFGYCDVLDDGLVVYSPWQTRTVLFGALQITTPEWLLFVRAVIGPDGEPYAVGQGHDSGACYVVRGNGRTLKLSTTFGVAPVLIRADGSFVYALAATSGASWAEWRIDPMNWTATINRSGTMVGSSQGFSDYGPTDQPLQYDPIFRVVCGQTTGYATATKGGVQIAQAAGALPPSTLVMNGVAIGTLNHGDCFYPHLSVNGQYWCCLGTNTMYHGAVPATIPPLVTDAPVTVPTFAPNPRLAYVFPTDVPDAKFSLE